MGLLAKIRNAITIRGFVYRKKLIRRLVVGSPAKVDDATFATSFNRTQKLFVKWNADRLGVTEAESLSRYNYSWHTVSGGHRGYPVTKSHHFRAAI